MPNRFADPAPLKTRRRPLAAMAVFYTAAAGLLFARFFLRHPLSVVSIATVALTAFCFLRTRRNTAAGLLPLTFLVPLVGSLPYLAHDRCPPPLLLVTAGFALGWLAGRKHRSGTAGKGEAAGAGVVSLLFVLAAVSGLLTAWRYVNFAPFGRWPGLEAPVNVRGESVALAVGDVWQTLVIALSGPLLFLIVAETGNGRLSVERWARALLGGSLLAFLVGLGQMAFAPGLGNVAYWAERNRINATFTDPNALGTYVALVFPLAAAAAAGARKAGTKLLGAAVGALGLAMLAGSGSRTGAAGIVLAAAVFPALLALRFPLESEAFRRRVVFATLAAAIAIAAFAPLSCGDWGGRFSLFSRLRATREAISRRGPIAPFLRERVPLWTPAVSVTLHHPLGGIGLGAFRYEVQNIAKIENRNWRRLDNANNLYLQEASELGLIGLAVLLAAFGAILAGMLRVVRSAEPDAAASRLYVGLATGWIVFLVLFMTGPHLTFEQVQATFWLSAAVFTRHRAWGSAKPLSRSRWKAIAALAAVAALALYQLALGTGELSPERRRATLGLGRSSGFYAWETDAAGRRFRWTREEAHLPVSTAHGEIRMEIRANHPDIAGKPVTVWVTVGGKPACHTEISRTGWRWLRFAVPKGVPDPADLAIRVSRTWCPKDYGLPADERRLGIAIARIENAEPDEPLPP